MSYLNKLKCRNNNIYFIIGSALCGAISIITIPTITWLYSVSDIGIYGLYVVVVGLLSTLFSFAIDQFFIRNYFEENDKVKLLSICLSLSLVAILIFLTLFFLSRNLLSNFIFDKFTAFGLVLLVICSISNLIFKYSSIVLRMEKEALYYALTQIMQRVTILIGAGACFILFGRGKVSWESLILIHTLSIVLLSWVQIFIIYKYCTLKGDFKLCLPSAEVIKKVVKYSSPLLASVLVVWGMGAVDKLVLKHFSNSYELGLYSNAYKFGAALILFQQMISVIWVPTSMKWKRENIGIDVYKSTFTLVVAVTMGVYVIFVSLTPYIKFLIHPDFHSSIKIIPIIMLFPVFYICSEFTYVGILYQAKTKYATYSSLISIIVAVVLSILLTKGHGSLGTAIAIAISYFVFFILRTMFSIKCWDNMLTAKSVICLLMIMIFCILYFQGIHSIYLSLIPLILSGFIIFKNYKVIK